MRTAPSLELKVWGDFACFTRPEMKVERVSYPVMTPSAARGVLEAIFWKPEFSWQVREIQVLKEVRYFSILRNELNNKASGTIASGMLAGKKTHLAEDDRAQRHTLALRDVAYLIRADIVLRQDVDQPQAKYRDQFRRRVAGGRCYHMPYLGCREFTAFFGEPDGGERPVSQSEDMGRMLFDIDYEAGSSGRGKPRFFPASLKNGVLRVPRELYLGEAEHALAETR
jgi:CRISPR-associated protein Cas5d